MAAMEKRRAIVAITGASGVTIGIRVAKALADAEAEVFCVVSDAAAKIIPQEIENADDAKLALQNLCQKNEYGKIEKIKFFDERDFYAPPASGSFRFDAMAIAPCSMTTLGKLANGIADNLIVRAAEVALKERRRIVVVPRETPLALTHIRNMETLALAGAVILPPVISFYNKPESAADMADIIAARIVQAMGFKQTTVKEWGM